MLSLRNNAAPNEYCKNARVKVPKNPRNQTKDVTLSEDTQMHRRKPGNEM